MNEVEKYVENYIDKDVEQRNSTFLNYVDGPIPFTEEFNRHTSNDGDHRIITSSNGNRQLDSSFYDYNNIDQHSEYEEQENGPDMLQYTNNDSFEGISGYETFCDQNI